MVGFLKRPELYVAPNVSERQVRVAGLPCGMDTVLSDHGHIVESGSHEELMRRHGGRYRAFAGAESTATASQAG